VKFKINMAMLITAVLFVSGCTFTDRTIRPTNDESVYGLVEFNIPESSYYYYTESQLQRKAGNPDKAIMLLMKAIEHDSDSLYLQRELAAIHMQLKEREKALKIIEKIIAKDPDNIKSLIVYGKINQVMQRNERAEEIYEKVIAADPRAREIYLLLGGLYMGEGDLIKAKSVYSRMVKNFDESFAGHFFLGKIHAKQGNRTEAEKQFKKTLDLRPELLETRFGLINLYKSQPGEFKSIVIEPGDSIKKISQRLYGRYDDRIKSALLKYNSELTDADMISAGQKLRFPLLSVIENQNTGVNNTKKIVQIYQDILKMDPGNIRAAMELGYFFYEKGMIKDAEKYFAALGKRSRAEKIILKRIVEQYFKKKKYDEGIIILKGMLKGTSDNSDIHYLTGLGYNEKKDADKAIMHLKKVLPGSDYFQNAVVHVPFLYREQGEIGKAIEFLENAIRKTPDNPDFPLYLGTLYEETEEYEKAEKILKKGLEIDPENSKLYFRMGVVYDKWGKKDASIKAMKAVVNLDPKHANALNYLGYTYADLGQNLDEAERLIKEALKYSPDDGYITDSLGWVYYKKGLFKKALKYLEKAVSLVPDDPVILEHLGDVYIKTNSHEKALELYRRSLLKKKKDKENLEQKIDDLAGE